MAIRAPAGHVNCFVVVVVVIGIGFDCLFSFAIRAKLAAVIDSIVVVVCCVCASDWGKVFLFWFSFVLTPYRECDRGGGEYGQSL